MATVQNANSTDNNRLGSNSMQTPHSYITILANSHQSKITEYSDYMEQECT